MEGEHGDLLPDVDDAITRTVTAAIWFGITTGYLTLTGSYHIPRKFLYSPADGVPVVPGGDASGPRGAGELAVGARRA